MNALAQFAHDEKLLADLEETYKDIHQHPELSMQEVRTAEDRGRPIAALGYEVTRRGRRHRRGRRVAQRRRAHRHAARRHGRAADARKTGLAVCQHRDGPDADGVEVGVAHSCGHDMHVTWLMGAAHVWLSTATPGVARCWSCSSPARRRPQGAHAMVATGRERFPKPDIILGQHVMVGQAGTVSYRPGVTLSAGDSLKIRLFGRGSHGSQPQTSIDPVIMAAATTMRLQTIVSREIAPPSRRC